jgi:hypothetical protein
MPLLRNYSVINSIDDGRALETLRYTRGLPCKVGVKYRHVYRFPASIHRGLRYVRQDGSKIATL